MWKGFIRNHIRENRGSSLSVRIAAFVAAFFLVLLCCTLYNVWHYDVVRCQTENGNYHARLTGALDEEALDKAMQALTGLASEGCLLGIISHVPQLRERIDRQIAVVKEKSGGSRAEIVG